MDPAWEDWLRKKRLEPYSQEEMDEIYRRADATRKRGLASDQAEMDMMNTFRRSDSYNRSDKKDFNPKTWSFEDEDKNENSNKKKWLTWFSNIVISILNNMNDQSIVDLCVAACWLTTDLCQVCGSHW